MFQGLGCEYLWGAHFSADLAAFYKDISFSIFTLVEEKTKTREFKEVVLSHVSKCQIQVF